jgi:hypothetical protein
MGPEDVDQSLFPDAASVQDAEQVWEGGTAEAAKRNPVGNFVATIDEAILCRAASSDRLQVKYSLKLVGGEFDGTELMKFDGLGSPQQAGITQGQLKALGVDVSKVTLKSLPATLLNLNGKKVMIACKQNGEYYNIRFMRLAGENITAKGAVTTGAPKQQPKGKGRRL